MCVIISVVHGVSDKVDGHIQLVLRKQDAVGVAVVHAHGAVGDAVLQVPLKVDEVVQVQRLELLEVVLDLAHVVGIDSVEGVEDVLEVLEGLELRDHGVPVHGQDLATPRLHVVELSLALFPALQLLLVAVQLVQDVSLALLENVEDLVLYFIDLQVVERYLAVVQAGLVGKHLLDHPQDFVDLDVLDLGELVYLVAVVACLQADQRYLVALGAQQFVIERI